MRFSPKFERFFLDGRSAALLGIMSLLTLMGFVIHYTDFTGRRIGHEGLVLLSACGALAAFGSFSLLAAMWVFWIVCDHSTRRIRVISFFVLLVGFFYGAVVYYTVAYLPAVLRQRKRRRESIHV